MSFAVNGQTSGNLIAAPSSLNGTAASGLIGQNSGASTADTVLQRSGRGAELMTPDLILHTGPTTVPSQEQAAADMLQPLKNGQDRGSNTHHGATETGTATNNSRTAAISHAHGGTGTATETGDSATTTGADRNGGTHTGTKTGTKTGHTETSTSAHHGHVTTEAHTGKLWTADINGHVHSHIGSKPKWWVDNNK